MSEKPGDRKQQILEALASMLESPKNKKVTTAALAEKLNVSEAALYRHFAGKAQMFEGLIEFIEHSIFGLINKILAAEQDGLLQVRRILMVMLLFAEKNQGMTRVLIGDALVNENERLQIRINQLYDRVESSLKQSLRIAESQHKRKLDPESQANLLLCFIIGRWLQFAKSGFKRKPMEFMPQQLDMLYGDKMPSNSHQQKTQKKPSNVPKSAEKKTGDDLKSAESKTTNTNNTISPRRKKKPTRWV